MSVANFCRACGFDFGSVSGFDAHRVGKHAYLYLEGLDLDPPVENGRRCLDTAELSSLGWRQDSRGRWRMPATDASVRFTQRPYAPSEADAA